MKSLEPKNEFIRTAAAAAFAEMIGGEVIRSALHVALEQFVMDQVRQDHFEAASKLQYELQGAKRFISIFLNLADPDTQPIPTSTGNLQWPKSKQPHRQPPQSKPNQK